MKEVDKIIRELGLGPYGQDWAIINSDGRRLPEFAQYLHRNVDALHDDARWELFELILASVDDALTDAAQDASFVVATARMALQACGRPSELGQLILDYWKEYWQERSSDPRYVALTEMLTRDPAGR